MSIRTILSFLAVGLLVWLPADAQMIGVKTYPLLSGDAFIDPPSSNASMGRISIAYGDHLAEPFENPATLMSVDRDLLFSNPRWSRWNSGTETTSSQELQEGNWQSTTRSEERMASTVSVPVGLVQRNESFGLGAMGAYQHMVSANRSVASWSGLPAPRVDDIAARGDNWSGTLAGAVNVPGSDLAVGAEATYTRINALDGVQFLYPGLRSLTVSGSNLDLRLGLAGTFTPLDRASIVAGMNRFRAEEHAEYGDFRPAIDNEDVTNTWYLQTRYRRRINERTTVGVIATVNRKEHPKIPEYPIASIPRDPGITWALNLGIGANWRIAPEAIFSLEAVLEPIDSKTWVEAIQDRTANNGATIHKGEIEQRNNYTFLNHIVRAGLRFEAESWLTLLFGSEIHGYSFDYYHRNYVNGVERTGSPQSQWTEVTVTGGLELSIGEVQFSYGFELLTGQGLLDREDWGGRSDPLSVAKDYLMPPNSAVHVSPIPVYSHRLTAAWHIDLF